MNIKISDFIGIKDIPTWKSKVVTISAQMGAGKSYFIKNTLYDYAKANGEKILILIHRLNCIEQFKMELQKDGKTDIINIMTYQKNEYCALPNGFNFNEYQYIVCDEFHYFLSDSYFNNRTEVSLERILAVKDVTKIFLSATSQDIRRYMNEVMKIESIDYELPKDYSFINKLTFFYKDDTLDLYMHQFIESGEKAVFFIQSATRGYELHKKYEENTLFNCGKSYKHYVNVDNKKITDMLRNERFQEQILITTTCLDSGVNLKDTELKHIVVDVEDIDVMLQCIGRKRIQDEEDKVNLYIHAINNNRIGGKITQLNSRLLPADYLLSNGSVEYVKKYGRNGEQSKLIYDEVYDKDRTRKAVNRVMYHKHSYDIELYTELSEEKYGYCKYISSLFQKDYYVEELEPYKNNLEKLFSSFIGKRLYRHEKEILINAIDIRVRGRQIKSYTKLNKGIEWLKLPYIIYSTKYHGKRCWIVKKVA